jgi:Farnesoic acid 0-methyl transferase
LCFVVDTGATEISMPNSYQYKIVNVVLAFRTSVIFKVKIINDACIALTTFRDYYDGDIYEIVVGAWNNTACVIRQVF